MNKTRDHLINVGLLTGRPHLDAPAQSQPLRAGDGSRSELVGVLSILRLALLVFGLTILAGCASTSVTGRQRYVTENLPRPNHIHIFSFASSASEIPPESAFAGQAYASGHVPTGEELALGQELGDLIAARMLTSIQEMGLPAIRGIPGATMDVNDIVIRGYLVSVEKGSTAKRMTIGFGSGGSELTTVVEGFQVTPQGLRKLGSATTGAKGSKGPGAGLGAAGWLITGSPVGLIVSGGMRVYGEASGSAKIEGRAKKTADEISDELEKRFKEEGWIY